MDQATIALEKTEKRKYATVQVDDGFLSAIKEHHAVFAQHMWAVRGIKISRMDTLRHLVTQGLRRFQETGQLE